MTQSLIGLEIQDSFSGSRAEVQPFLDWLNRVGLQLQCFIGRVESYKNARLIDGKSDGELSLATQSCLNLSAGLLEEQLQESRRFPFSESVAAAPLLYAIDALSEQVRLLNRPPSALSFLEVAALFDLSGKLDTEIKDTDLWGIDEKWETESLTWLENQINKLYLAVAMFRNEGQQIIREAALAHQSLLDDEDEKSSIGMEPKTLESNNSNPEPNSSEDVAHKSKKKTVRTDKLENHAIALLIQKRANLQAVADEMGIRRSTLQGWGKLMDCYEKMKIGELTKSNTQPRILQGHKSTDGNFDAYEGKLPIPRGSRRRSSSPSVSSDD